MILELALWKAAINNDMDSGMREHCRRNFGLPVIVPNVLSCLSVDVLSDDEDDCDCDCDSENDFIGSEESSGP